MTYGALQKKAQERRTLERVRDRSLKEARKQGREAQRHRTRAEWWIHEATRYQSLLLLITGEEAMDACTVALRRVQQAGREQLRKAEECEARQSAAWRTYQEFTRRLLIHIA